MAFVPGMPTNLPDEAKEKAQASYDKQQAEKSNSSSSSSDYDTTKTTVPGMPSDIPASVQQAAQTSYNTQQAQKSSEPDPYSGDSASSNAPKYNQGIVGSEQKSSSTTTSTDTTGTNNAPKYNQGVTSAQIFIQNLPSEASFLETTFGQDAAKIIDGTNTAEFINELRDNSKAGTGTFKRFAENTKKGYATNANPTSSIPTSVQAKLLDNASKKAYRDTSATEKELIKAHNAIVTANTTFEDMLNEQKYNRNPYEIQCATSIDYTRMQREGYRTVYVEDGGGWLQSKDGIYTIGKNNLIGIPENTRTVMVDKDNNWYFIKDTDTEKKNRDFVDAAEVERTTKCNEILDKYNKYAETYELYAAKAKEAQDKSVLLNSLTEQAFIKANKTRSAEDIAVAQDYVEQLKNVNEQYNAAKEHMDSIQPHLTGFINQYAQTANKYDTAISNTKGWSVEDELAYQELAKKIAFTSQNTLSAMAGKNGMPSDVAAKLTGTIASRASSQYLAEIAAYNDMTKRREANGNTPAYISNDAMKKMQETADNMQKLVERYNKWDNALIHTENGEGFGTALRSLIVSQAEEYGTNIMSAIIAPYIKDNQKEKIKETITTLQDSQKKALKNMDEALIKGNPFINAIQYVGHKVYEKITGKDAGSQEILNKNTLYLTATEMQKASEALKNGDINYNDYIQFERYITNHTKSVMFNNVISNLDVFDLTSIQREFVAWRMGAHPELYSDDPKFKRMQDAYKKIYGTDYAGKQDQLRMAYVALHTETNLDDYVYLDGSDLRHEHLWKGEQYGTLASLAVGMFTDLANLGGLASKGLGEIGAAIAQDSKTSVINTLKDAASDALEDMIMRNSDNIAQDTVTAFVRSDEIQSKISKAVNAAVHDVYTKGDDITEAIAKRESNLFNDIINKPTSELVEHLNAADKADFAIESKNIVAKMSDDVLDQALKLQKNTVIVSTLRDTANAIEDLQSVLFKATCPVAGAVVGISKAYKGAQYIINNHLNKKLSRDATDYIVSTSKQAYAVASKAQIDFVTDKGKLKAYMDSINMAFAECAEGAKKNIKPIVNEIFEPFSKNVLRTSANQYVSKVVDHYTDIFNKGGLKSLERAAGAHGFVSFKQMYSNIKDNIGSVMREYSDDVDAILSTLDAKYARAAAQETINDISNIQHVATIHTNAVKNFINNGIPSCLPSTNPVRAFITVLDENATVIQNPTLLQGASINMANSIYNFTRTANPEWMKFTNAAGEVDSIVVAAQDAIDVLDELATGSFGIHELTHAQEVVQTYLDQVENIYMKNLDNAKADALIDGIGYTNYADKIESLVVGQPPLNDTVLRTVSKNLQERITNMGYTVSVEDIINKVFVDPHALEKLDPIHRDTIYRVMWDKGSTCIAQINDKNFIEFASKIADSNSPENKALVMYADALETLAKTTTTTDVSINAEELLEKSSRIKTAIQNASAVSCTKELDNVLAKSGIDSVTHTSIIDSWVGLSNHGINYIAASYPVDQAIDRISKMLCNDVQAQLAKHEGRFPRLTHLGATSVNVETNALTIERIINNNPELAAKLNEGADEYTDICFSILRTSDSGAPKDIALHVRGSKDKALVLRIKAPFDTTDDFAGKTFSCNAESARAQYKALGNVDTISREEFQKQLKDFITQQKDIALDKNKTLRFIGFNSSDALTGDNRFMNRTIRSCGVSINTANSIDLADIIRSNMGEYVLSSDVVADIRTGVSNAVRRSKANAITLDISPNISYDTAYTCRELLGNALKDVPTQLKQFSPVLDDISTSINKIGSNIDNIAYTTFGNHALGMLVDTKALSDLLVAAGAAPTRVYQDIMASMRNVLGTDNVNQLTLHKVIDTKFVSYYFDTDKLSRKIGDIADHLDYIHTQTQRINRIYNDIVRTDLIDALNPKKLGDIYHCMLATARTNNRLGQLVRSLKFDSLTTAEKYAVTSWLYDNIVGMLDEDQLINLHTIMLHKGAAGAYVLPEGRQFITNTLLDYTDAVMDKFAVKYLDESEAGQQFAIALNRMQANKSMIHGMKEYDETLNALSRAFGVHGTKDRLFMMQSAAVYNSIDNLHRRFMREYTDGYNLAIQDLIETYGKTKGGRLKFDQATAHKIATQKGVEKYNEAIKNYGERARSAAVKSVLDLDADGFRAHLIRNCGGGLIIDPSAQCVQGVDLAAVLKKWSKDFGLAVEDFKYSNDVITDRTLFRVYVKDIDDISADELFKKYNHANIEFKNSVTQSVDAGMRSMSFKASDMSLMDGAHMQAFKENFFDNKHIIDIDGRFNSWKDELYCCNMWTDADLKYVINPYYSDDPLRSLAQSTHQVRNNISALHDFGTIMDNPYMKSDYIMREVGLYNPKKFDAAALKTMQKQLNDTGYKLCRVVQDGKTFRLVDFTNFISMDNYDTVLKNTICVDKGTYKVLSEWNKTTTKGVRYLSGNPLYKKMAEAYKAYKDTIRNRQITWYLYGNIGTAVRNMVDSSTKGFNEVMQYNESPFEYIKNYVHAIDDVNAFANTYDNIIEKSGVVNRETIIDWFGDNTAAMDEFNLLYSYVQTTGGDELSKSTLRNAIKESRTKAVNNIVKNMGVSDDVAEELRRIFDSVYASPKYKYLNSEELANHAQEIHDKCMDKVKQLFVDNDYVHMYDIDLIDQKLWEYAPTVVTWGDRSIALNPIMRINQKLFNDAETRARIALYKTFMHAGATEAEAMEHVVATQFHYAGIGHVEDFMPFTQYCLYNAAYWFDHADVNAIKTAWRFAQYNGDGSMTNAEIADLCAKYQTNQYFLYDRGADEDYDNFVETNLTTVGHLVLDGVDSYLGLPREFQAGSIDLNGTHYIKLGNSFVEETDLVISLAVGTLMFAKSTEQLGAINAKDEAEWLKTSEAGVYLRHVYDTLKYTPLYDKLYSPWKATMDLSAYWYDRKADIARKRKKGFTGMPSDVVNKLTDISEYTFADAYHDFVRDKSTHSEALSGIPLVGVVAANVIGRAKALDLNLGEFLSVMSDPVTQKSLYSTLWDVACDVTGGFMPSLIGTRVAPEIEEETLIKETYAQALTHNLLSDPSSYIDYFGRLQQMGFSDAEAKELLGDLKQYGFDSLAWSTRDYILKAQSLIENGFTPDEVLNLFDQLGLNALDQNLFLDMYNALPGYLKYDKNLRDSVVQYYKALGMNAEEAWSAMLSHPSAPISTGGIRELSPNEVAQYNKIQSDTYNALHKWNGYYPNTDAEWKAYWDKMHENGYYPTSDQWHNTMAYFESAGYSKGEAAKKCLDGFFVDANGKLQDLQGISRAKHAANARAQYNNEAFKHPLGYPDFNTYYQTLPEFIRYEKGAFKRINNFLKEIGISDYNTRLTLIQQGAYFVDATGIPGLVDMLGSLSLNIPSNLLGGGVNNINDLMTKLGGKLIKGTDGKYYVFANCTGLQRPRNSFSYARKNYNKNYNKKGYTKKTYTRRSGKGRRSYAMDRMYSPYGHSRYNSYPKGYKKGYKKGRASVGYKRSSYSGLNKYMPMMSFAKYTGANSKYYTRSPFVRDNNVSTYSGMTGYRGSSKPTKYITNSYRTSTYSLQNFLHGASYGMRKVYRIDMRQYKTGAYSTKSAYPAAYRNIAVAYRHNLYKDMYAKYGASRMMMRANKAGYSNASIVRLRRNEIYNRERYAERRDRKAETKKKTTR